MNATTHNDKSQPTQGNLATMQDPRDVRALTECMSVLEHVGHVRGADDMYLVVSESGREYTTCVRLGACECRGSDFQDGDCKHVRAVRFAIGERVIPAWVNRDAINNTLGAHVDGEPVFEGEREREGTADAEPEPRQLVTDGGAVAVDRTDADAENESGCPHDHDYCERGMGLERPELCWECWEEWSSYSAQDYLIEGDAQ